MKLLLDTHVWIWSVEDPQQLGRKAKALLRDSRNERLICAVSALEAARLVWSGDVTLQVPLDEWVTQSLRDIRADCLPVTPSICIEAYRLPEPFHRDPADRQIVACARLHNLTLLTADERILGWGHVAAIDARK